MTLGTFRNKKGFTILCSQLNYGKKKKQYEEKNAGADWFTGNHRRN
jgi:hypothetical protein